MFTTFALVRLLVHHLGEEQERAWAMLRWTALGPCAAEPIHETLGGGGHKRRRARQT